MGDPAHTPDGSDERDPVDLLVEQFLQRHRAGESIDIEAYADEHPEQAEQLRELLPTLLMLETVRRDRETSASGSGRVSLPALERLGDFRIERELGRGGMGVVFEAVQESLDRRVALKVLPRASLLTGNQLERFRREAQIAARLHHTNIVPVYGSGESDGYHWYAMQFIAGQSLDRWRDEQRARVPDGSGAWRARARFVARLGASAASALHCAHGQGTLHRDIKPANFLLDQDEHLWVTDFGLAKALESEGLTKSGDVIGTLQYMAPEQFAGHYDVRSEVYALGVTLYELLMLEPAFQGRTRSELIERVQSQRTESLRRVRPEVPEDLVVIIGKAMEREPDDRYADCEQLQHDLEAFLEERPIQARRMSAVGSAWRWCRRNRGMAALGAAALAAVLMAGATGWVAYVVTSDALDRATSEGHRAEDTLQLSLTAFGDVFDALVGRDPVLGFDEDPETGEQTVVVQSPLSPRDVGLLQEMLVFYDAFANTNADSQTLRYEAARAHRRVGAIRLRLGGKQNLQAARRALEEARAGFEGITDGDMRRDLVQVHLDLGRLSLRIQGLRGAGDARTHFEAALALLDALPDQDLATVRFERANVLHELSRAILFRSYAERGGASMRLAMQHHRESMALLERLAADNPDDTRARALQARVLRTSPGDGKAELQQAIAILRDLVAREPHQPEFQLDLCSALLQSLKSPPWRKQERVLEPTAELALLREANSVAERLYASQPLYVDAMAMRIEAGGTLGRELIGTARRLEAVAARLRALPAVGGASQTAAALAQRTSRAYVDEATSVLQESLADAAGLGDGVLPAEWQQLYHMLDARGELGLLQLAAGNRRDARAQVVGMVETMERLREAAVARGGRGNRPGRGRPGPGGRQEDGRGPRPGEGPPGARGERGGRGGRGERGDRGDRGDREERGDRDERGDRGEGRRGGGWRGLRQRPPWVRLIEQLDDAELTERAQQAGLLRG